MPDRTAIANLIGMLYVLVQLLPLAAEAQAAPTRVPVPTKVASQPVPAAPDPLENNWSPATATPIAVGAIYDLTFACPVEAGCPGGDHDYLAVPVKAGLRYLLATFDLGPGVDTVIDLFWGDEQVPYATNDDVQPGVSLLSVLHWRAPSDGTTIIRIGPRTGGVQPQVFDPQAGRYRFVIALAGGQPAQQIEARIATQLSTPTPAAVVPRAPSPAERSNGPKGPALVITSTTLYTAPDRQAQPIQTLAPETAVTLLGQVRGAWVWVQPDTGVVPGWVYGPDLRRGPAAAMPATPVATPPAAAPARSETPRPASATPIDRPAALPVVTARQPPLIGSSAATSPATTCHGCRNCCGHCTTPP